MLLELLAQTLMWPTKTNDAHMWNKLAVIVANNAEVLQLELLCGDFCKQKAQFSTFKVEHTVETLKMRFVLVILDLCKQSGFTKMPEMLDFRYKSGAVKIRAKFGCGRIECRFYTAKDSVWLKLVAHTHLRIKLFFFIVRKQNCNMLRWRRL